MQDEMRIHLELYQADLRRRGVPEDEARRRALAEFGSVAARKEECRDAVGLRLLGELRGDVSYAFRLLRRSPSFALIAVLSLGLGIGANTAIFTLIDTVLVKTLPVADPQRLFFVDNSGGKSGGSSGPPYPCFERLRAAVSLRIATRSEPDRSRGVNNRPVSRRKPGFAASTRVARRAGARLKSNAVARETLAVKPRTRASKCGSSTTRSLGPASTATWNDAPQRANNTRQGAAGGVTDFKRSSRIQHEVTELSKTHEGSRV